MNDHETSRIRRILKWAWTGTRWMLFMASGCLTVLVAYLWTASFSGPPQSALAVFGAPFTRPLDITSLNKNNFYLRVLDRDSDWIMISEPDDNVNAPYRFCLYAVSESGRFIVGQMMFEGRSYLSPDRRAWLQTFGLAPDVLASNPQWSQFLASDPEWSQSVTALPWKSVVYCNISGTGIPALALRAVSVSYWFATLISSLPLCLLAVSAIRRLRRYRRRRMNACTDCGYNLTGNESGKCPECSTPVPKQETIA